MTDAPQSDDDAAPLAARSGTEDAFARTSRVIVAAVIFTVAFGLGATFSWMAVRGGALSPDDAMAARVGASIWAFCAVACAALAAAAVTRARWPAIALWPLIALWRLDWGLMLAQGGAGVPWLAAIGTYQGVVGARAVFRYRRFARSDRARASVSDIFA